MKKSSCKRCNGTIQHTLFEPELKKSNKYHNYGTFREFFVEAIPQPTIPQPHYTPSHFTQAHYTPAHYTPVNYTAVYWAWAWLTRV